MKTIIGSGLVLALLIYGANAQSRGTEAVPRADPPRPAAAATLDWPALAPASPAATVLPEPALPSPPASEIDVVDAHWMALTMWGEARREGEAGMRAVGHVIDNRRRSGRHGGYATQTVSEAWQFSAWNQGDPNRAAIEAIDRLRPGSVEHRAWQDAKRIAAEILAGRSADPTHGALFYHTTAVAPAWSAGLRPVTQIGSHLFFVRAR